MIGLLRIIAVSAIILLPLNGIAAARNAEKSAQKTAEEVPDLLTGTIDPLNFGRERVNFLRSAGVNSELDEAEFEKDRERDKHFAQIYDRWSNLLKFDKSKDKSIDWFEALAYRQAVRKGVIAAYDKNGDGRLRGPEREKANRGLARGQLPEIGKDGRVKVSDMKSSPGPAAEKDKNPRNAPRPRPNRRPELPDQMKEFDKDNNGRLNADERQAYGEAMRERRRKEQEKRMDADGNGEVTLDERREFRYEQMKDGLERMSEQHDKNKDGELGPQEATAASQQFRDGMLANRRRQQMQFFDKNNDGKLSEEEQAELNKLEDEVERRVARRKQELLEKFDANNNREIDTEEAYQLFKTKMEENIRAEHNGESPNDMRKYFKDGRLDYASWMLSPNGIDQHIMLNNVEFGEILATPLKDLEAKYERNRKLAEARKRARQRIENNLKKRLNRRRD